MIKKSLNTLEMLKNHLEQHINIPIPMRRRATESSIARALAKKQAMIAGEWPTGTLDSKTGVTVLELLREMSREGGNTVIIVTHNADIAKCADKVIRMKNGCIDSIGINEHPASVKEVSW
ncbi:MAG: hypothetical protein V8Q65_00110 [Bacteroidaceae bacterium]